MTDHPGTPCGGVPKGPNVRNGSTGKTVSTDSRPGRGSDAARSGRVVEPRLVAKRQTRLASLDDKVLGLFGGGMTVRDISHHLSEL